MTRDTYVSVEFVGGPGDGKITLELEADIRLGRPCRFTMGGRTWTYYAELEGEPGDTRWVYVIRKDGGVGEVATS